MEDYSLEKKMYLLHLEKAYRMEEEKEMALWLEINRAKAWLTLFNKENNIN
jgi:hypothetical protein